MSQPDAKKTKMSNENRQTFTFTKGNNACDRALLVDNVLFRVHSETLIEHSDYFRVMFTADFLEKNENEIELKGVDIEYIKRFLSALFEPGKTAVEEKDLALLCKVFSFYRATSYFADFLKVKNVFNRFPVRDLLELSVEHGISEMKDNAEGVLVTNFVEKFPVLFKKYDVPAKDFKFDDHIINSLNLVLEFGLLKLKEKVEARLASDFNQLKRHSTKIDDQFIKIMYKYNLEDLATSMVPHVLSLLENIISSETTYVKEKIVNVLGYFLDSCYRKRNVAVELIKLKEGIENYYIDCMKNDKYFEGVFRCAREYGMSNFIKAVEDFYIEKLKSCNQDDIELVKEWCTNWSHNGMIRFEEAVAKFIVRMFENCREIKSKTLKICSDIDRYYGREDRLKEVIENYLVNDFENNHSFENIKFAFFETWPKSKLCHPKFNATVMNYLKTVSLDDPIMKAGYHYILALSDKECKIVFKAMLRKPEGEE